ncbi:NUDIX hydrolase [Magnetospirillum aberrantis]|uniref:NUDIX hydrolase n=1 Tax=Magnetospirillum aberrantis SpK TaxID=908842 RepID=A0A7C9UUA6_9PROT|nr:NUDIX hydrolase [Magnetospirillum aberrantis]NFV78632.1 NUDIX hydrolase [Magnetospirillum aberrantis SpK]
MMTYEELQRAHPELFNNPDDAPIRVRAKAAGDGTHGILYADPYLLLLRDPVVFASGRAGSYLRIIDQPIGVPGVAVLPRHQGNIILINHFRHATRRHHLEIPRGYGETGRSSVENAAKEVLEEIGGHIEHLINLGSLTWNSGLSNGCTDLFLADLDEIGAPATEEGVSAIMPVTLSIFEEWIASGRIADSFTIACWSRAHLRGLLSSPVPTA